ncbi:MAG TPA: HD domain-containing phosphohydrolase, partial [Burkholderiales bacterium]
AMPDREYWQFHDRAIGKKLQSKLAMLEQTLERLSASEARYRGMFEHNSAVMLLIDPTDGCIADANPAAGSSVPGAQCLPSRHRLSSGEIRDVEVYSGPISAGGHGLVYCIVHDVTERRKAEEQVRSYLERLEAAMMSTIDAVRVMSELRDPHTSIHEQRVSDLAAGIALEIGLSSEQARQIRVIGLVHDIGKVTIPAEILSRPGPLTELEFALVKHHAEQGYEILKRVDFQWPVAEAIRQHHERMDGSGYPRGLRGEEILLKARIIAVADVVEAMSMHRPYRPGWGTGAALEEISSGAGTAYDPRAVQACLTLFG